YFTRVTKWPRLCGTVRGRALPGESWYQVPMAGPSRRSAHLITPVLSLPAVGMSAPNHGFFLPWKQHTVRSAARCHGTLGPAPYVRRAKAFRPAPGERGISSPVTTRESRKETDEPTAWPSR